MADQTKTSSLDINAEITNEILFEQRDHVLAQISEFIESDKKNPEEILRLTREFCWVSLIVTYNNPKSNLDYGKISDYGWWIDDTFNRNTFEMSFSVEKLLDGFGLKETLEQEGDKTEILNHGQSKLPQWLHGIRRKISPDLPALYDEEKINYKDLYYYINGLSTLLLMLKGEEAIKMGKHMGRFAALLKLTIQK